MASLQAKALTTKSRIMQIKPRIAIMYKDFIELRKNRRYEELKSEKENIEKRATHLKERLQQIETEKKVDVTEEVRQVRANFMSWNRTVLVGSLMYGLYASKDGFREIDVVILSIPFIFSVTLHNLMLALKRDPVYAVREAKQFIESQLGTLNERRVEIIKDIYNLTRN